MSNKPKLTAGETAQVAWYVARMAKRCIASERIDRSDLERKVDRVMGRARQAHEEYGNVTGHTIGKGPEKTWGAGTSAVAARPALQKAFRGGCRPLAG